MERSGLWLGVRGKLMALVLVLLIPILVLNAVGVIGRFDDRVQQELEQSESFARAVSTALVNYMESLWDTEMALGTSLALNQDHLTPDAMESLLRDQLPELTAVSVLTWVDASGVTVASTIPGRRGLSIADRDYYQRIVAGEDKVVSDVLLGRTSGTLTVAVVRAIRHDGRLEGMLVGGTDFSALSAVLPAPGPNYCFGLIDRQGMIVYRSGKSFLSLDERQTSPDDPTRRALQGEVVLRRSFVDPHDGVEKMGVSMQIKQLGWAYFSSVPVRQVLAGARADTARDVVVISLAAFFFLLLALYVGRSILRPIGALERAARAISTGDLAARVSLTGRDEVAAAVQMFDSMAARVQLADEVLKARVTAIAHVSRQALEGADMAELSEEAALLVALSLGVECVMMLEMLPDDQGLVVRAGVGLGDGVTGRTVLPDEEPLVSRALERLQPVMLDDVPAGPEQRSLRLGDAVVRSAVAVPVLEEDRLFGIMIVASEHVKPFSQSEIHFLQAVSNVVATALQRRRERDRALAQIETERARLHDLFEQAPAFIAILRGPEHVVAMANQRYRELIGGRAIIGKPFRTALPELAAQGFDSLLDQVYTTGVPCEGIEVRVAVDRKGDGTLEDGLFNYVYQPMRDAQGQVDAIFVFVIEVTGQVRARRKVEALAADLRTLAAQQAAVAALGQRVIAGADLGAIAAEAMTQVGRVLGVSTCRVLELQPDGQHFRLAAGTETQSGEAVPLRWTDGVPTLAGYTLTSGSPVVATDLTREERFRISRAPGVLNMRSSMSVVIPGEEEPFGVLTAHSQTHRVFTEDEVNFLQALAHVIALAAGQRRDERRRQTQHTVARILAESPDSDAAAPQILKALCEGLDWDVGLLWVVDRTQGTLTCAETWTAPGVDAAVFLEQARRRRPGRGKGLAGAAWAKSEPVWNADMDRDGLHGALWIPVLLGDEVHAVVECFSREVRRPDAAVTAMVAIIGSQIGQFLQRKRAEEDLRRLNAELEERVAARTAELAAANRELEAFSYSVSHDLRAPLRTIDGFSQALAEDYSDQINPEGHDYLRRIRAATRHMGALIDDILRLSRVLRSELHREHVDLTAMAWSVAADLYKAAPERQVSFTAADGLTAWGDERLLRVVVQNLLANAWKFTSRREHAQVTFGAEQRDGQTVFFVRDNGAGFDMAYADKLFVPFQRLHTNAEFEGTGIGLATIQRIIQRHGGQVWADGAVGQGATFFFTV